MAQKPRIFRLFVSSTFSDMVVERSLLQERVFPSLKRYCEAHGARFQAIDLRWGISQEAGLNQRATYLCLNEIARCQRMTRRPNFLLLLGDRYGWQPLPDDIPADEWDLLTARLTTGELDELSTWYRRDDNAVPPRYVLQPRQGAYIDQDEWNRVEKRLREILLEVLRGLGWSYDKRMKYETSVTEQEIDAGIFQYVHAREGTLCFFRTIEGLPTEGSRYRDANADAQARLINLKQRLEAHIPDNIQRYPAQWIGGDITFDPDAFCTAFETSLQRTIEAELATFEEVSPLEVEAEAHRSFMMDHTRHFVGRVEVLDSVSRYLTSDDAHPLVLYGQSGVGKSTLIAKAVESASHALYRFIGTTPESSDIRSVLVSVCEAILARYGLTDDVPQEYEELIKAFPLFLEYVTIEKPLVIFLDALDQLSSTNAPSNLRWLPNELPPHVKLVMSVIPGAYLDALKRRLPSESFVEITPMTIADGETMLDTLLSAAGRILQPAQHAEVLGKFAHNGLPLYLKLAFEEARLWHSYTADFTLHPDVPSLLENNLFARLSGEAEHGEMLVSRSMAYLAASRNGLSEGEMVEVLRADPVFWTDFEQERTHEVQREALRSVEHLPIVVWSRLALDLEPYLVERGADGSVLLNFYHRQFGKTVDTLYLAPQREAYHAHLADYFKRQREYTARKAAEQAYQQAKAGLHEDYVATLTDYRYLQASLDFRSVEALIEDCGLREDETIRLLKSAFILSRISLAGDTHLLAGQLSGRLWVHREQSDIADFLDHLFETARRPCLLPRSSSLINAGSHVLAVMTGHEHSVEGALLLDDSSILSWSFDGTLRRWSSSGTELAIFLGHVAPIVGALALEDGSILSWSGKTTDYPNTSLNTLRHWTRDGVELEAFSGHTARVNGALVLEDGSILSWSEDKTLRLWKHDGTSLEVYAGHTSRVNGALVLEDGSILSWSRDHTLRRWRRDGKQMVTFSGHTNWVNGALLLDDGTIVSWSCDGTLRRWGRDGKDLTTFSGHKSAVNGALVLGDGSILSWSNDETLRRWAHDGTELAIFSGHTKDIRGALVLDDGSILSWSPDHTLRRWAIDGAELTVFEKHEDEVQGALAIDDGTILSWSGKDSLPHYWLADNTLRRWTPDGTEIATYRGHASGVLGVLALDDGTILSWSSDCTLRRWALDGMPVSFPMSDTRSFSREISGLRVLDDDTILSWAFGDKLRRWTRDGSEMTTSKEHQRVTNLMTNNRSQVDKHFIFSFISRPNQYLIRLSLLDGTELATLRGHEGEVLGALTLDDGSILSWSCDHTLRRWDRDGTELATFRGHEGEVLGALVLDDGSILSWSRDHMLRRWDRDGTEMASFRGHLLEVWGALGLDDGSILSWSYDGTLRRWDRNGTEMVTFSGHESESLSRRLGVLGALALDDRTILSWSQDNTLRRWGRDGNLLSTLAVNTYDLNVWSRVSTFVWAEEQGFSVNRLFAHLGDQAVTSGQVARRGSIVYVYSVTNGRTLAQFVGDAKITCLAVLPSDVIVAGDAEGRVIFLRWLPEKGLDSRSIAFG